MPVSFKWPWSLKKIGFNSLIWGSQELPDAYRRIESISMNDDVYYIITNFRMKGSDTIKFSFSVTAACNVLGCYTSTAATTNYSLYVGTTNTAKYLRYNGGAYNSYVTANQKYDMVITPNGATGISNVTWTEQNFTSDSDLCIGTTSLSAASAKLKGTLYGNIEVVGRLKLIPCVRASDNVVGYYDTYSSIFYEPAAGSPIPGPYV